MIEQKDIRRVISGMPLLSAGAARLLKLIVAPEHEMAQVIEVVRTDPVLTARLLRVANSPVIGPIAPIASIDRAVSYLGERMVMSLALAASASTVLNQTLAGYEGEGGELWRHSLFAAFSAQEIMRLAGARSEADIAFTAGLLHDIGKAVVSDFLRGTSGQAVARIEKGEIASYLAAEQEALGLDHAEAGFELAASWQLPAPLPQLIRCHHQPEQAELALQPLAYSVHLGDILAMMAGAATGSDAMQYRLHCGYTQYFDLSPDCLGEIMLAAEEEFRQAITAGGD